MSLTSYEVLRQQGILPVRKGPVRFAVAAANGLTSNSWRAWVTASGVYLSCRDNFKDTKISLHTSGRWRMGYTSEVLEKYKGLLQPDQNRAWDVWDEPPPSLPNTVTAFRLLFPTSELAVRPEQRTPKDWAKVIYLEAAPPGKITVVTLFLTLGGSLLRHETEPSFCLASLDIGKGRHAQLIAHGDPEMDMPQLIEQGVSHVRDQGVARGVPVPDGAYAYFFGRSADGARFLVGARMDRTRLP